jgi:vacuolar-type H+-ATPase subunit H
MIEEHLGLIRSKETESKERVATAEARAVELVEKERESAGKLLDEERLKAAELERSLLAAARRNADEKVSALRAENAKRLAGLAVVAKKSYEKAIDMILKEFREGA